MAQLQFDPLLQSLGINALTRSMIIAQVVGRMAAPGSERTAWDWLNERSAWPELARSGAARRSIMRLYQAADVLVEKRQTVVESRSSLPRVQDLFDLSTTVSLFDPDQHHYFEGAVAGNPKAKRGHSKEKRTDCPLLTLGLVLGRRWRRVQSFGNDVLYDRVLGIQCGWGAR